MKTIVALTVIAIAHPVAAHATKWQCRGHDDASFSIEQQRIAREARDYAEKRTKRIYTCFTFVSALEDGSRFLHLDRPVDREGKPIVGTGGHGTVRVDEAGKVVEYIGGR